MTGASTVATTAAPGSVVPDENRRAAFRVSSAVAVQARTSVDEPGMANWAYDRGVRVLDTVTEDIAVGGLRLRAPDPLPPGARLDLRVQLGDERVDLQAQVVRAQPDMFGASVAVAFEHVNDGTTSQLSRYVTACQRRRVPWIAGAYRVRCELPERYQLVRGMTTGCSPGCLEVLLGEPVPPAEPVTIAVTVDNIVAVVRGVVVGGYGEVEAWRTTVEIEDPPPTRWIDLLEQLHRAGH